MNVTIHSSQAALRVGDVFSHEGLEYVVDMVNESRARCIPLARKQVSYETLRGDKVEFETDYSAINISPNSEVSLLRRLGKNWHEKIHGKSKKVAAVAFDGKQGHSTKTRKAVALQAS